MSQGILDHLFEGIMASFFLLLFVCSFYPLCPSESSPAGSHVDVCCVAAVDAILGLVAYRGTDRGLCTRNDVV